MSTTTYALLIVFGTFIVMFFYIRGWCYYSYRKTRPVRVAGYLSSKSGDSKHKYIIFRDVIKKDAVYVSTSIENLKSYRMNSIMRVHTSENNECRCLLHRNNILFRNAICLLSGYLIVLISSLLFF